MAPDPKIEPKIELQDIVRWSISGHISETTKPDARSWSRGKSPAAVSERTLEPSMSSRWRGMPDAGTLPIVSFHIRELTSFFRRHLGRHYICHKSLKSRTSWSNPMYISCRTAISIRPLLYCRVLPHNLIKKICKLPIFIIAINILLRPPAENID